MMLSFMALLLASATALAAPTAEPQGSPCMGYPPPDQYVVEGLTAQTHHLSSDSYYNLNITYNPTGACGTSITVVCTASTSTLPPLSYLGSTPCELPSSPDSDSGVAFSWSGSPDFVRDGVEHQGGFTLNITDTYGAGYHGSYELPGSAYHVYGHSPTYDDVEILAPAEFEVARVCA